MAFNHGVRIQEIPTAIVPPVNTEGCLPVFIGTAPVHTAKSPAEANKPVLCYSLAEAVEQLGYSEDWKKYTLCEAMYSQFQLFNVAPVVFINVFDITKHKTSVSNKTITVTKRVATIEDSVIPSTLICKVSDGGATLVEGTDYEKAYDEVGSLVINILSTSQYNTASTLSVSYDKADTTKVTQADIIGGIDSTTGKYQGVEAVNAVYSKFGIVPGQIAAPGWSHIPAVAAVMVAKAGNINGLFRAIVHTDIPTDTVKKYSDVKEWKARNNYGSDNQTALWPMVQLGNKKFHLSTQIVGVSGQTDAANGDIPYESPSNKGIQCNGLCLQDGTEVDMNLENANYLNSQGIITALNIGNGYKLWGNEMACYPENTDPKDRFMCVRKMFNWHRQTFILTYFKKVDKPLNRRLIDSIVDSENIRLNGLVGQEALISGSVEFLDNDNPVTNLIDGIATFYTRLTPPVPAREIVDKVEFDPNAMKSLFQ